MSERMTPQSVSGNIGDDYETVPEIMLRSEYIRAARLKIVYCQPICKARKQHLRAVRFLWFYFGFVLALGLGGGMVLAMLIEAITGSTLI